MLLRITLSLLAICLGWASALVLEGWILAIHRLTGDDRVAFGAVVIALAAAAVGAGLLSPGPESDRSPRGGILRLGLLAAALPIAGFFAADRVAPALLAHAVVLGLLAYAVFLIPGCLALGGLLTGLTGLRARAGGRLEVVLVGLSVLGASGGLLLSQVYLLHPLGIGATGSVVSGAVLLLLAGLAAGLLAPGSAAREPIGDPVPDPDDGRRAFGDAACGAVGLGLGLSIFVVGRYGGILIPSTMPGWTLVACLFLAAFGGMVVLLALLPRPIRRWTPALALVGSAVTAFVIAWDWSRLVETMAGPAAGTPPGLASVGTLGRRTVASLGMLFGGGGGAAALAVGAAGALVLLSVHLVQDPKGPIRRPFAWVLGGTAAGVAAAALLAPQLEGQIWVIPAWLIGVAAGLTALAARWPLFVRTTSAILVVGAITAALARDASKMNLANDDPAVAIICTPTAWVEITEIPGPRRRERVRVDRRLVFETASTDVAATRRREVALPLRLRPEARRILILDETLGLASAIASVHPEARVEVTWLIEGLGRYYGPSLVSRASRSGRDIRIHSLAARTVLAANPGGYDVIVGLQSGGRTDRPVGPDTVEFMQAARSALRPGGVFCLWVRFDRLTVAEIRSLGPAFREVFPGSTSVVLPGLAAAYPAAGLVGTADDEPVRLTTLPEDARDRGLFPASMSDPLDLLAHFVARSALLKPLRGARAPTDDRPFLRFGREIMDRAKVRAWSLELYARLVDATIGDRRPRIEAASAPSPDRQKRTMAIARKLRQAHLARLEARAGLGSATDALQAALAACREGLERAPNRPFVWESVGKVGRALIGAGRLEEAGALYDLAVAQAPRWGGGYLGQAMILFERHATLRSPEDWKPIETLAEKALELDHGLALAWIYLGIVNYRGHHDAPAARGCLEKAAMIDPDDPLLKSYLWLFIDQDGRIEEAARMLLDAVEALPDEERLWDALYKQVPKLLLAGKPGQALYVLRRIEPHYRDDGGLYLSLSEVLEAIGDLDAAVNAARRCCKLVEPPVQGYYLHLYRLLKRTANEREARELRGYMQDTFGVDPDVLLAK